MKWIEIKSLRSLAEIFPALALEPYSFFLDSSDGSGFSFAASNPYKLATSLEEVEEELSDRSQIDFPSHLKHIPFMGGAVGYLSYDAVRIWEPHLGAAKKEPFNLPPIQFGFYDTFFVEDHRAKKIYLITLELHKDSQSRFAKMLEKAVDVVLKTVAQGERAGLFGDSHLKVTVTKKSEPERERKFLAGKFDSVAEGLQQQTFPISNLTYDEYCSMILKAKEYIQLGEIYQVNLSQCLMLDLEPTPDIVYQFMREINPASFSAYLNFSDEKILCTSPERFLKVDSSGTILTEPIKGTIQRGKTPKEDEELKESLLRSEKNRAELMMIVDLERNDLGKICEYGSVIVPTLCEPRTYSTVHHLVSVIQGKLKTQNIPEILRATFPGGSITGAPKLRAMQIIDELEPHNRGIYTGSIGYIDYRRQMDLNIAIRTIIYRKGKYFLPVGGGIVSDSVPEEEFEETLHKGAWATNFLKKL